MLSQCLGEFLHRLHRIDTHPAVLHLGVLCGANIAFLGAMGCRISVDGHAPLLLNHAPDSFSGVLAWDAISRMPVEEATPFVDGLRKMLMSTGVILAYFPGPPGGAEASSGRYRIVGEGKLAIEPSGQRHAGQKVYQNRDIYRLFSRFDVVRLAHHKSGTREVLVAKSRHTGKS